MGLNGSKSIRSFFSVLPSSLKIVPQKSTRPLVGVLGYNFNLSLAEVIAVMTDFLLAADLMLVAVPSSSFSSLFISEMFFFYGIIKEIILVPFPLASSNFLIKRLIFHYSTLILVSSASIMFKILLRNRRHHAIINRNWSS